MADNSPSASTISLLPDSKDAASPSASTAQLIPKALPKPKDYEAALGALATSYGWGAGMAPTTALKQPKAKSKAPVKPDTGSSGAQPSRK
ncbi:hypothetical protein BKA93DRAFT_826856 [Sparassis latifolia]|uniref:Uncharacterized protein n=1 Tax=Sparassis crispa TaxID=139825 RepID=A0A401GST8_9APHY|nr:hypothetical protein SCP_0704980 [Sparassis crispa]GBE85311.1 hypothetical protein SCP_0704980 [Sparassis crispa]